MYRVGKVLNHNSVIGIDSEDNQEYLILGKGVGFGKKVSERFDKREDDMVYSLQEVTERGDAKNIALEVAPITLELANAVLSEAEKVFGRVDRRILFPISDHIEYALQRAQNEEQIRNPLTADIQMMFQQEFKVAQTLRPLVKDTLGIELDDHELGYIALHIHTAIEEEKVSQSMQMAQAVRTCITLIEEKTHCKIDVTSLAYNRLMNHIRCMVARAVQGEQLKVSMNDYMEVKYPGAYIIATSICDTLSESLKFQLEEIEVGYLAMHIARTEEGEGSEKA